MPDPSDTGPASHDLDGPVRGWLLRAQYNWIARSTRRAARAAKRLALRGLILALAMTLIDEEQYGSAVLQLLGWHTRVMTWTFRLRPLSPAAVEDESP